MSEPAAPQKYRKKPVEIDAVRFTGFNGQSVAEWCGGQFTRSFPGSDGVMWPAQLHIDTMEGRMTANVGDWVIRGTRGEFYPCNPIVFDDVYEPANEEVAQ